MANPPRTVRWSVSSRKELKALPKAARDKIGYALWEAQIGKMPQDAKVLHGFAGASVLEIRAANDGNAYRAIYTVRFKEFVYVLHVFQKKSKRGKKTPASVMDLIRQRLHAAETEYAQWKAEKENLDGI